MVKDFHVTSLHRKIEPLLLVYETGNRHFLIRIRPHDVSGTLASLEDFFKRASPNYPFHYFFLDERFDVLYRKEQRMQQIFGYCSGLAIFIACLGLFGLASFTTEQRTREIGIRKALGASVLNITILLSREFTKWVLLANVIAWPLAYVVMTRWLQNFAYRITIAPWIFFVAAIVAFLIAFITVSGRAITAALANPVDALRYE